MRLLLFLSILTLASAATASEDWVVRFQIDHGLPREEALILEGKILRSSVDEARDPDEVAASYFRAMDSYKVIGDIAKANLGRNEYLEAWSKAANKFQRVFTMSNVQVDNWFEEILREYEAPIDKVEGFGSAVIVMRRESGVSYVRIRELSEEAIKVLDNHPIEAVNRIGALVSLTSCSVTGESESKGLGSTTIKMYDKMIGLYDRFVSDDIDPRVKQFMFRSGLTKELIEKARKGEEDSIVEVVSAVIKMARSLD